MAVAIVTNGDLDQQVRKRDRLGLAGRTLIASSEVGERKPGRRVFEVACARLGLPASACAFVGDDLEADARGSARAGLRGVWLDRSGQGSPPSDVERITSIRDLVW